MSQAHLMSVEILIVLAGDWQLYLQLIYRQTSRCHQALLGKVVKMSERFDHDELSISELFGFLAHDVIVQHIMDEDRKFFPYLPTPDLEG